MIKIDSLRFVSYLLFRLLSHCTKLVVKKKNIILEIISTTSNSY